METELIQYQGYRYVLRLQRDYDPNWPSWKADQQRKSIKDGRSMFDAVHLDVWERNVGLVARVQQFMKNAFPWHSARNAREALDELARAVRQGAVYVLREEISVAGGFFAPAKGALWTGAIAERVPSMSSEERYLAQLDQLNATRPTWAETDEMLNEINIGFMKQMTGASPLLDAMFKAAGWNDKYAESERSASTLLSDAQSFEYGDVTLSEEEMEIAGLPYKGTSGSWVTSEPGKMLQWRQYGAAGTPLVDFDFEAHHGHPNPHAHTWEGTSRDQGWPISILP